MFISINGNLGGKREKEEKKLCIFIKEFRGYEKDFTCFYKKNYVDMKCIGK